MTSRHIKMQAALNRYPLNVAAIKRLWLAPDLIFGFVLLIIAIDAYYGESPPAFLIYPVVYFAFRLRTPLLSLCRAARRFGRPVVPLVLAPAALASMLSMPAINHLTQGDWKPGPELPQVRQWRGDPQHQDSVGRVMPQPPDIYKRNEGRHAAPNIRLKLKLSGDKSHRRYIG